MLLPTVVDVRFPVEGGCVPIDHSYALYSAISRIIPETHTSDNKWNWGIHPIFGNWSSGDNLIKITSKSKLLIRSEAKTVGRVSSLAYKSLVIGHSFITLKAPNISLLTPVPNLYSRMVTIAGFTDVEKFREAYFAS